MNILNKHDALLLAIECINLRIEKIRFGLELNPNFLSNEGNDYAHLLLKDLKIAKSILESETNEHPEE